VHLLIVLELLQPFQICEILGRSNVPVCSQRMSSDHEVLNALLVEYG